MDTEIIRELTEQCNTVSENLGFDIDIEHRYNRTLYTITHVGRDSALCNTTCLEAVHTFLLATQIERAMPNEL